MGEAQLDAEAVLNEHFGQPTIPHALTLLSEVNQAEMGDGDLAETLHRDRQLAMQVVRLVQSGHYGDAPDFSSPAALVGHLGPEMTRQVLWVATLMITLGPDDELDFRRFWAHAFRTHGIAQLLAKEHIKSDPSTYHLAALLHDSGKLVYVRFFPDQYRRIREVCATQGMLHEEAEVLLGMPSHRDFGATLAEQIGLPAAVRRSCLHHELSDLERWTRNLGEPNDIELLVTLANLLDQASASFDRLDRETYRRVEHALCTALSREPAELQNCLRKCRSHNAHVPAVLDGLLQNPVRTFTRS